MSGHKGVKRARTDLLPTDALYVVAEVFGKGAEKYADRNWERGYAWSKSYGALQRHLFAWWAGENKDRESGLNHMAHVAWHALVLLSFQLRHTYGDDRPAQPKVYTDRIFDSEVTNPEELEAAKAEISGPSPTQVGSLRAWNVDL